MGKAKTSKWGLRSGHPNPFRRTVQVGYGKNVRRVTLVFEPGAHYDLTDQEVAGLKHEIDGGLIVPFVASESDHRDRLRPTPLSSTPSPSAGDVGENDPSVSDEVEGSELATTE